MQAKHADEEESSAQPEASSSMPTKAAGTNGVPKGFGKIIRDAEGNIVDVQMGDEEDADEPETQAEGAEEEIPDPRGNEELAGWVELGSDPKKRSPSMAGTRVVHGEFVWLVDSAGLRGCDCITAIGASHPCVMAAHFGAPPGSAGNRAHMVYCQRWSSCQRRVLGQCRGGRPRASTRRCSGWSRSTGKTSRRWRGTDG